MTGKTATVPDMLMEGLALAGAGADIIRIIQDGMAVGTTRGMILGTMAAMAIGDMPDGMTRGMLGAGDIRTIGMDTTGTEDGIQAMA